MSHRFSRRGWAVLWSSWFACVAACRVAVADASPVIAKQWRPQVIYLVLTDRFANGDPTNDRAGVPAAFDPADIDKFHGGDFRGLQGKIPYLKELGITAVWITPVYRQVGVVTDRGNGAAGYHGYWADFTFPDDWVIEPKLGTDQDFTVLIDAAHASQMKVVLDMVVNHAGYGAAITRQKPEFFEHTADAGDDDQRGSLAGLPDFAQEKAAVAEYLSAQGKGWVERFKFDGIRMDTAKHVPASYFKDSWFPAVRGVRADLFVVGEALYDAEGDNPSDRLGRFIDAGFDSVFNFPVHRGMVESFAKGRSVDVLAERVKQTWAMGRERAEMLTNLVDNHDLNRFTNEPGFGVAEEEIVRRYHLALAAMFTLPGIPQLYYGDEIGMYGPADHAGRRDMPDWAFTAAGRRQAREARDATDPKLTVPKPDETFAYVKRLIRLRKDHPALYEGDYTELWRQNGEQKPDVYAFARKAGEDHVVVVFNNGTLPSGEMNIPLVSAPAGIADGAVVDLLGASPSAVKAGGRLKVNLPGKSVGVYKL